METEGRSVELSPQSQGDDFLCLPGTNPGQASGVPTYLL